MRVGFYQFRPSFGRPRENAEAVAAAVRQARADLLVAPELATSGYVFASREESAGLAETLPGPSTELLQQACRETGGRVVLGIAEKAADGFYNSAALIGPDGVEGVYRKTHLFGEEKLHFAGGRTGFPVFTVQAGGAQVRLGMLVCFDHFFPEAARSLALGGAQIICHPSNLVLPEYAQLSSRVRSIENRVFWILANRYGSEDRGGGRKLEFTGCSQVTAPDGKVLVRAPAGGDALEVVEIDPRLADDKKITGRNHLWEDRRPELYRLQ
jgi:predicted amidohydrolase